MATKRVLFGAMGAGVAMVGLSLASLGTTAGAAGSAGYSRVARSESSWAVRGHVIGHVPATQRLSISLWLEPDVAGATRFAGAVSTPGSAVYRDFLTPRQYRARFGPTGAAAAAAVSWLRSEGFSSISVDSTRADVAATGSAALVERAFKVQEDLYKPTASASAGPFALYSNDRNISLPSSLAPSILAVTGLDNAAPASTLERSTNAAAGSASSPTMGCSQYYGQKRAYHQPVQFGKGHFPLTICGYTAKQLRAAYGANRVNTGKGVTVAVVEQGLAPNMWGTLVDYAHQERMPSPVASRYSELSLGRGSACGDPFNVEEQLDVEAVYDMAYKANILVVGGDSCVTAQEGLPALFAADQAILDGSGRTPLAAVVSNSWENPSGEGQSRSDTNVEHAFLLQAAAEGVSELFSAGDQPGVLAPSDDPYATAVGGTSLGIGETNNRMFETGWSTVGYSEFKGKWRFPSIYFGTGGGASLEWAEPSYQVGVVPPSLNSTPGNRGKVRAIPDISADADPFTGMLIGTLNGPNNTYTSEVVGGTSEASPLVAGMIAATEQGQPSSFGFVNPVLYKLAGTSAIHDALPVTSKTRPLFRAVLCPPTAQFCQGGPNQLAVFDQQSHRLGTTQVTLKGYDTMTGIGTPNGQTFIAALRRLAG